MNTTGRHLDTSIQIVSPQIGREGRGRVGLPEGRGADGPQLLDDGGHREQVAAQETLLKEGGQTCGARSKLLGI